MVMLLLGWLVVVEVLCYVLGGYGLCIGHVLGGYGL